MRKKKFLCLLAEKEAKKKQAEENKSKPQETRKNSHQSVKKLKNGLQENEWFGTDRVMTGAAMGIHEDLMQQGIESDSDEYYNQINKRMKEYFPQKFAQSSTEEKHCSCKEPVQNVASVSRRQGGRKSVKLTKSQVVIAKKLGVPLEEYAKYVKEGA